MGRVSAKWAVCNIVRSLHGQVIVITGANTGLGAEAALDLAKRGATLVLACRSFERTRPAVKQIREESGNNDVHYMHLDLASLQSVREFAGEVRAKYPAIHTLVCNAGVWVPMDKQAKTEDGFEVHAGVNHLGHFLLTSLLLDRLEESAPSRVVVMSSGLMNSGQLDLTAHDHWKTGRQTDPSKRSHAPSGYCDSKLMNALFTRELASRVAGKGVGAVCVCPGWCYTDLARHTGLNVWKKILFAPIAFMFMRSARQGAANINWAVVEEEDKLVPGGFYRDKKVTEAEAGKLAGLAEMQARLWKESEQLTEAQ